MARSLACLIAGLLLAPQVRAEPPPLTEEQRATISKLATDTKTESDRLKSLLERRQVELSELYSKYSLDENKAKKLEDEVVDLQRQMLTNYRKMQVELRTLVGEERFVILRQRIDNMLKTPKK